ncbi:MAG: tripartite tricarboxylate transporter substrate-binding protein [Syntrophales bacterium]|jgi:tripartite-type tricarboxylate transporter receptor subunit TctC|nr:tripartite tricarboxylate transporter substrate-binding protein [Syntrophales bacterium]
MKKKMLYLLAVFFIFGAFFVCRDSFAAAPYYQGKTITLIVGFSPGGGYDQLSRILAKYMPKHIPGEPVILVQNMTGAAGMVAANNLYNIAKPDGLTFGIFNRGMPFAQLLKAPGVQFDLRKYAWLGSAAEESATLALRADLPFKTLDDVLKSKEPIMIGSAGGPADSNTQFVVLLKEYLKMNVKTINYPASSEVMLAIERKEVDGRGASSTSIKRYVDRGLVRLWIRGKYAGEGTENLPVDEDLVTDKIGKTIMAMRSATDGVGRPYVAPPGTPANVMKILREGMAKALKDPELLAAVKKAQMEVKYVPPEECLKRIDFVLNQPPEIVKEASKYIRF